MKCERDSNSIGETHNLVLVFFYKTPKPKGAVTLFLVLELFLYLEVDSLAVLYAH